MLPDYTEDYLDDDDDTLPMQIFASSDENDWWMDMLDSVQSGNDIIYDEDTNEFHIRLSVNRNGKRQKEFVLIAGDNMLDIMTTVGAAMFTGIVKDAAGIKWEITCGESAATLFNMFMETMDATDDSDDVISSMKNIMTFRSGEFKGFISAQKPDVRSICTAVINYFTKVLRKDDSV